MSFRKLHQYFFKSIKNPKKALMRIRDYVQRAYIFIQRNDRPTIINENKSSPVFNLESFYRVPLITIFSRVKLAQDFYQEAYQYIAENNKFVVRKGVAILIKNTNAQVKQLMFSDLKPFIGKKFIMIDVYTLPKIEKIASVNYHFLICLISSEQEKLEISNHPEFTKFINIIITIGCKFEPETHNIPLVLNKNNTHEALLALEFIISAQINYEEDALIPIKCPAFYDVQLNNGVFNGLDALFKLQNIDISKSTSFQNYLEKNLNHENIIQIYVNETIELLYLTLIDYCKNVGDWTPFATRLIQDGYRIEMTK